METLLRHLKKYIRIQAELYKLKAAEKVASFYASVIYSVLVLLLSAFCLLFAGIAAGIYLGEVLKSPVLGFSATGGVFFLLLLIASLSPGKILRKTVMDHTVKKLFSNTDTNEV
jgi:membrane protein implicated in regulation of membrane protease activity